MGSSMSTYRDAMHSILGNAFMKSGIQSRIESFLTKMKDGSDAVEFAKKQEDECDDFIHRIAGTVDNESQCITELANASDTLLATMWIRVSMFEGYAENNPNRSIPLMLGGTEKQIVVDCLINFWKAFCHEGPLNFL